MDDDLLLVILTSYVLFPARLYPFLFGNFRDWSVSLLTAFRITRLVTAIWDVLES